MPKLRQIPNLFPQPLAGGDIAWHWKPSKRLRALGFVNRKLGVGGTRTRPPKAITSEASDLNDQVDALLSGTSADAARPRNVPRVVRFAEAARLYMLHDDFTSLSPNTQAEYRSRLTGENGLSYWAEDGQLPVRDIDAEMVLDLRRALMKGSKHRTAALLRVLRLFLAWCKRERLVSENAASAVRIPEPPKRRKRLIRDDVADYLLPAAHALGFRHIAVGAVLGFYTTQREGDLLATTRFRMNAIRDISDEAKAALAGKDGKVLGIVLEQGKTGQHVSIPLVPVARDAVETELGQSDARRGVVGTFLVSKDGGGRCHEKTFQRDFRRTADHALALIVKRVRQARAAGDRDAAWTAIDAGKRMRGIQFRDLRRSGMCWMRDLGVPVPLIAAISGHSIEQTQKILDTYLPRDTRAAAEAMAIAVTRQSQRDAADNQKERAA